MKSKLLLVVFLVLFFGLIFKGSVFAQYNQYPMRTNPDVPQNFHTYTQNVVVEVLAALSCQITGIDPINPKGKCLGVDTKTGRIGFVEGGNGMVGIMGNLISMTYEIPVSSGAYVKNLAEHFGIAKKTYAQPSGGTTGGTTTSTQIGVGYGFEGLMPLLELWKIFRNIVYLFFVLIFIIIGLGIMFRIKIDPRTVMTIQNQLPKIIIALILVTLSYAIAGFLIDMMYVFIYLIFNLFANPTIGVDTSGLSPETIQGSNPVSSIGFLGGFSIVKDASWGIGSIIGGLFSLGPIGRALATLFGTILGAGAGSIVPGVGTAIGAIVGGVAGGLLGFGVDKILATVGGIVAFFVIGAALLTALFKLWFALIKAYIFILINTVIAPFWIAGGLIPGSTKNFGTWIRDMAGNLSAFPATLFMLLMGRIFIEKFGEGKSADRFVPPFIGNPGNHDNFSALIGLGIILLTPQVVTMVRAAIKAPEGKYSSAIGKGIQGGAGFNQVLFAPVGRNLFGRKNPMTGKRQGGLVQGIGRLAGQRAYNRVLPPPPAAGPRAAIRNRLARIGQGIRNVQNPQPPPPAAPPPPQQQGGGQNPRQGGGPAGETPYEYEPGDET